MKRRRKNTEQYKFSRLGILVIYTIALAGEVGKDICKVLVLFQMSTD